MIRHLPGMAASIRHQDVGIVSVIPERLRSQCDAAVSTEHRTVHADNATEALLALRTASPRLLLLSPSIVGRDNPYALRELVDRATGAIAVAVVGDGPAAHSALMELGAAGIHRCIDVSERGAWAKLRAMMSETECHTAATILQRLVGEIGQMSPELRQFFEILILGAPRMPTVRELAPTIGVRVTTLVSRFVRAGLPSPKEYLVATRLLYAAAMFAEERMTVGAVAYRLRYASPQSMGRHLRNVLGVTPSEFRSRHTFNGRLDKYVATVVQPFVAILRTFDPIRAQVRGTAKSRGASESGAGAKCARAHKAALREL